jgi:hypothetical protein
MTNPISGYSPNATPSASLRDNAVQPARSVSIPNPAGTSTFTMDVGLAPRAGAAGAGSAAGAGGAAGTGGAADFAAGPSRPNVALLEAMQASRQTSALFSSLLTPGGSFFQPPTPAAIVPPGQSALQRPSLALLESVQAGRTSSALLSSIIGPVPGGRTLESGLLLGERTGAATTSPQWTPNSQAGRAAYMMQGGLTQNQGGQWLEGANTTHQWFA